MADEQAPASSEGTPITEATETPENLETGAPLEGEEIRADAEIDADKTLTKTEKVIEKRLKKLSLKFNGKEYDEELPFEIPDEPKSIEYMKKQLQLAKLSQSKSQELATYEKQVIEFIEALRADPEAVLSDPTIGLDLKKFAAQIIEKDIANSKKSPEQKQLEEAQAELKKLKADADKKDKDSKDREHKQLLDQYYQKYESQLNDALDKAQLPKSQYLVNKVVDYLEYAALNKIDLNVADVLPLVQEEMKNELKSMFQIMPEDVIEEWVGKETINKVRKKNIQKQKAAQPPQPVKTSIKDVGQKDKSSDEKPKQKQSFKQFFGV